MSSKIRGVLKLARKWKTLGENYIQDFSKTFPAFQRQLDQMGGKVLKPLADASRQIGSLTGPYLALKSIEIHRRIQKWSPADRVKFIRLLEVAKISADAQEKSLAFLYAIVFFTMMTQTAESKEDPPSLENVEITDDEMKL